MATLSTLNIWLLVIGIVLLVIALLVWLAKGIFYAWLWILVVIAVILFIVVAFSFFRT